MEPPGAEVAKRANRMHQLLQMLREAEDEQDGVRTPRLARRSVAAPREP